MIPAKNENPDGLHKRYCVQKVRDDGTPEPEDPDAVYFVLRLDGGGDDKSHVSACRLAALRYADAIENDRHAEHLGQVAAELRRLVLGTPTPGGPPPAA